MSDADDIEQYRQYLTTSGAKPEDVNGYVDYLHSHNGTTPQDAQPTSIGDKLQTGLESYGNTATLGYLPHIQALAEKYGTDPLFKLVYGDASTPTDYLKSRDSNIARQKSQEERNPGSAFAGKAAGIGASMLLTPELGPSKTLLGAIGKGVGVGAGFGVAQNPGDKEGQLDPWQIGDRAKNAAVGGVTGGVLSGGLHASPNVFGGLKEVGKKGISTFLGPSVENINSYLDRPNEINSAKTPEQIKDLIDEKYNVHTNALQQATDAKNNSVLNLGEFNNNLRAAKQDAGFNLRNQDFNNSQALDKLQQQLKESYNAKQAELKGVKNPMDLQPDVHASLADLKNKVINGSNEAYDILGNDPEAYSVRGAGKMLRQMADEMNIQPFQGRPGTVANGKNLPPMSPSGPVTSQTAGVQNELHSLADRLENTPEMVPASELKKILQQLDASGKAMYGQPGFDGRVSQAYKQIRATIDQGIKAKNPAYAAKMADVSANTNLLDQAVDRFGDPRTAQSRLSAMGSDKASLDRELLQKLGGQTGKDFSSPVDQFYNAQQTLKNPKALDEIKQSLPEFNDVQAASSKANSLASPQSREDFINQQIQPHVEAHAKAQSELEAAQRNLDEKKSTLDQIDPFGRLRQNQSQGAIDSQMKPEGKENFETRKALERLSPETNFPQMIDDTRVNQSFKKGAANGSRNALMFGGLGAATGGLLHGAEGAAILGSAGTTLGGVVDKFGPQIAKQVLNMSLKAQPAANSVLRGLQTPGLAKNLTVPALQLMNSPWKKGANDE